MTLQTVTVGERFIAQFALEVVRVQMFQTVLVQAEPFAKLSFTANHRVSGHIMRTFSV